MIAGDAWINLVSLENKYGSYEFSQPTVTIGRGYVRLRGVAREQLTARQIS